MFDLKYRPRRFSDVLGNDGVKKLLLTRSAAGTLADQSMMFGGPKGCGKTTLARLVARSIMCTSLEDGEPCGECTMCMSVLNETCQAVQEMDAASQGTVDRVRTIVHDADYGTLDGGDVHVYLIDEAQRLSKAAQDALLKAIEERLIVVILCTTEPHKIQGPIRDRMEEYPVSAPPMSVLTAKMASICRAESIPYDEEALEILVKTNGLTPRSSYISLSSVAALGDVTGESVRQFLRFDSYELVDEILCLLDSDPADAFRRLDDLSSRESPSWIRDTIVQAISSGLRGEVGARTFFPVAVNFFSIRGRRWCDMAISLGSIDRPSMADMEAVLLSDSPCVPVEGSVFVPPVPEKHDSAPVPAPEKHDAAPASVPAPEKQEEEQEAAPEKQEAAPEKQEAAPEKQDVLPAPPPAKSNSPQEIDVDGVRFSSNENLTSLDAKIGKMKKKLEVDSGVLEVGLNAARTPIPEKQFVSGFLNRLKGSG